VFLLGIVGTIVLQLIVMEVPIFATFLQTISMPPALIVEFFALSLVILLAVEIYKAIGRAYRKKGS
jgi:hypothetical protein